MISRSILATTLIAPLALGLAACGGAAATTGIAASPMPQAAPTNTSIAGARALTAGESLDVVVPCGSKLYFGPFNFAAEGDRVALVTSVRSVSGAQVCGGGAFVDGDDVQQAVAGTGCVEHQADFASNLDYAYTPGAGGSTADPVYLSLWTGDVTGDPAGSTCGALALHLEARTLP